MQAQESTSLKLGRPPKGASKGSRSPRLSVPVTAEMLARIKGYAARKGITEAEAARQLLADAIKSVSTLLTTR